MLLKALLSLVQNWCLGLGEPGPGEGGQGTLEGSESRNWGIRTQPNSTVVFKAVGFCLKNMQQKKRAFISTFIESENIVLDRLHGSQPRNFTLNHLENHVCQQEIKML